MKTRDKARDLFEYRERNVICLLFCFGKEEMPSIAVPCQAVHPPESVNGPVSLREQARCTARFD